MRILNKYMNYLNLTMFFLFFIVLTDIAIDNDVFEAFEYYGGIYFNLYQFNAYFFLYSLIALGIINIICSIINYIKKNKLIGTFFLIIGILHIINFELLLKLVRSDKPKIIYIFIIIVSEIILILCIINLIKSLKMKKNKTKLISLIMVITITIIMIIEIVIIIFPIIMDEIYANKFEKILPEIYGQEYEKTYIAKIGENEYIIIDENGEIIANKKFQELTTNYYVEIDNKPFFIGKINGKEVLLNSKGEELFKYINENLYYFIDDYLKDRKKYPVSIMKKNFYEEDMHLSWTSQKFNASIIEKKIYDPSEEFPCFNTLEKYEESNKSFETSSYDSYIYFKNPKLSNKVLQVIIKNKQGIKSIQTEDFHFFKKEYYLIDFAENSRVKLECDNLEFESNNTDIESVIVFSNGSIPFYYDRNKNGFFDFEGHSLTFNAELYRVLDANDRYIIVLEKKTGKTIILSTQTEKTLKKLECEIKKIGKQFYIADYHNELEGRYKLLDKDFNIIETSDKDPEIYGDNIIVIFKKDQMIFYYFNDKELKKIYDTDFNYNEYKNISEILPFEFITTSKYRTIYEYIYEE